MEFLATAAAATCQPGATVRTVALLGMPNSGKSTLYNRLTGGHARIANWPGLTVDLLRGRLPAGPCGRACELVDLPGIHDLRGSSEDEAIVRRFLQHTPPDLLLAVVNASHLGSELRLVLQLRRLGLPMVLALSMSDEAARLGVRIDEQRLARDLGLTVVAVSARRNEGMPELLAALHEAAAAAGAGPVAPLLDADRGDGESLDAAVERLAAACQTLPDSPVNKETRRIDAILLHPLLGPAIFLAIVLVIFELLYGIGTPLQDLLERLFDAVQRQLLEPSLLAVGAPAPLRGFLLEGVWLGVATVTSFLPILFLFYLLLAVVEDSGYLPRAAFLMDGFMRWLGLDGRAFVLQVMGFGCNVPSILGTRVIRDRGMRLLAMLCIPFALCQARLTVFVFLAGVFFPRPWWAPGLVVFGFYLLSFLAAIVTGLIFRHVYPSRDVLLLELPPYRNPSLGTILRRAWTSVLSFLVTTRLFIVGGAAAIWLLTHLPPGAVQGSGTTFAEEIGRLLEPLLAPIGMNPALTLSLFFGFIAKEILLGAMAVIHATPEGDLAGVIRGTISPLQALSFMTFVLLYTPCLSTVVAQARESGSRGFTLLSLGWSLLLAWLMALIVFQAGQRLMPALG